MSKRANREGTIRKRPNGTWEARVAYIDPITGHQIRFSFYGSTAKAVRAKLKEARSRIDSGAPVRDAKRPVADWLAQWRTTTLAASDRKETTKELYEGLCRRHLEPAPFGELTLDRVTAADVERLILTLRDKKLAESTVRTVYTILRAALDGAVRDQLISRNPAALVKRPRVEAREAKYVPVESTKSLLEAAKGLRYYPAVLLIAATGIRRGEVAALQWDDVDLVAGEFVVRRTLGRVKGILVVTTPKTGKARRAIPLSPALVQLLKDHRVTQEQERGTAGSLWQDNGLVFPTETGTPVDPRNLLRTVQIAARKINANGVGVHSLRHSAAVAWLESGVHIKAVSDLLGHASIAITGDIYGHTSQETARSAVGGLAESLGV